MEHVLQHQTKILLLFCFFYMFSKMDMSLWLYNVIVFRFDLNPVFSQLCLLMESFMLFIQLI